MTAEESEISSCLCPISFTPLARDSDLGDRTHEIIVRYLERLDSLLDYDPAWESFRLNDIRNNFRTRETLAKGPTTSADSGSGTSGPLWDVIEATVNRLAPTPPLKNVSADFILDSSKHMLRQEIREQVRARLWASPSTFGDAKAFLCASISGGGPAATTTDTLSPEFIYLKTDKTSLTSADCTHRGSGLGQSDVGPLSFLQSLKGSSNNSLTFLEMLDETRYGDKVKINDVRWKGIRQLLRESILNQNSSAQDCWTEVPKDHITIASGKNLSAKIISLPSREPLSPPTTVYTGYIDVLQRPLPFGPRDLDLKKLLKGEWVERESPAPPDSVVAHPIVYSSPIKRSGRPDEAFFSMLYWVTGDEESCNRGENSFENDTFILYETADQGSKSQTAEAKEVPKAATGEKNQPGAIGGSKADTSEADSFLSGVLQQDESAQLPGAFGTKNLAKLIAVLASRPSDGQNVAFGQSVLTFSIQQKAGKLSVDRRNKRLTGDSGYEVVLFHTSSGGKKESTPRLLLLVTAKVSLWKPKAFTFVQQRNPDDFDEIFKQQVVAGGSPFAFQRTVMRDFSLVEGQVIAWRDGTILRLLEELLLKRCFPNGSKPSWDQFDLSVTVRRLHRVARLYSNASGKIIEKTEDVTVAAGGVSSFPLLNVRYQKGIAKPKWSDTFTWFQKGTDDFLVDFQWSSPTNLQFLRLSGLRVTVQSGTQP